jgi:hypothetical protein
MWMGMEKKSAALLRPRQSSPRDPAARWTDAAWQSGQADPRRSIAGARLLNAAEDGKRRAGTDAGDAQQFPAVGHLAADGPEELGAVEMQILRQAQTKELFTSKADGPFFRMCVIGILREP